MSYRVAYQRSHWQARPIAEVPLAGWLHAEVSKDILRLAGWVHAREGELATLEARSLSVAVAGEIDRPSPDVEELMGTPEAANCRFEVHVPLTSMRGGDLDWTLWAIDSVGQPRHFATVLLEPERTSDRPVLVVGAARSGTSAVGNGVRAALGLFGYGECHAMPLSITLMEAARAYYGGANASAAAATDGVLLNHVDRAEWDARIARSMRSVYHGLHRGPFVDKTPGIEMLDALPVALYVWPQARVVFCRRRGLENVESRKRKYPGPSFADHCRDWTASMLKWRDRRSSLPESQLIEIDQFELATDPGAAAERLASFLKLTATQQDALRREFEDKTPERTSDDWRPVSLDAVAWTESEREQFTQIAGEAMEAYGYSLDEKYWTDPPGGESALAEGSGSDSADE